LTVISAMHDITLAAQYADRLLVLAGGRLVAEGPPGKIATAELVAEHYGADVRVVGEGASLAVIPVRRA
jgi:iron complex transport system ATP-binding protein